MILNKWSNYVLALGVLSRNTQNLIKLTRIERPADLLENLVHFLIESLFVLWNESYVNLNPIASHCANSKSILSLNILDDFFKDLRSFYSDSGPGVEILRHCLKWSHENHVILFVPGNHWRHRLREIEGTNGQIAEKHSVLLKGNLQKVLENLGEDLTADQRSSRGNGWDDFTCLKFYLVSWQGFNWVVGCSEVREESDEVNVAIGVIVFLKLDFFKVNIFVIFHIVNQSVNKFRQFDFVFLGGLILLFGLLVCQLISFLIVNSNFLLLNLKSLYLLNSLILVTSLWYRDNRIQNLNNSKDKPLVILIVLIEGKRSRRSLGRHPE